MSASVPTTPNSSTSFTSFVQEPIKPNPHPYAIRTTSTGILSRSNSSGRNVAASRHHYVPLPPSPTKRDNKTHRPTRSLTSAQSFPSLVTPQSLPVPPEFTSNAKRPTQRTRAETLPSLPLAPEEPIAPVELPANPKIWTALQLSTYLLSALRVSSRSMDSGESLPLAIVQDVAAIVREAKINGRLFLRMNEEDLESMGINQKWHEALLTASRTLRQSAIKGKIWGTDSDSSSPPGAASPTLPSHPFSSALYNSSSSSLDLSANEAESEMPRRRYRGRVRGMVESFERSGSFSSEGSFDGGNPEDRQSLGRWLREDGRPVEDEVMCSPSPEKRVLLMCADAKCVLLPEEPSVEDLLADEEDVNADADRTVWGARAWEELDLAPGVTVKRVPDHYVATSPGEHDQSLEQEVLGTSLARVGSGSASGSARGSGRGRGRDERRVVTAIFTPGVLVKNPSEGSEGSGMGLERSETSGIEQASQTSFKTEDAARAREAALEIELAETRALVAAFKLRLEGVELELARLQELEAQRERQHGQHEAVKTLDTSGVSSVQAPSPPSTIQPIEGASSPVPQVTSSLPAVSPRLATSISGMTSTPPHDPHRDEDHRRDRVEDVNDGPSALSDLPQYVFLVGFGVCAVVLRVMIRKFAGRGQGLGSR